MNQKESKGSCGNGEQVAMIERESRRKKWYRNPQSGLEHHVDRGLRDDWLSRINSLDAGNHVLRVKVTTIWTLMWAGRAIMPGSGSKRRPRRTARLSSSGMR